MCYVDILLSGCDMDIDFYICMITEHLKGILFLYESCCILNKSYYLINSTNSVILLYILHFCNFIVFMYRWAFQQPFTNNNGLTHSFISQIKRLGDCHDPLFRVRVRVSNGQPFC